TYSNRWLTCILLDKNSRISREDIRLELEKDNIESRPLWKPMHLQPVFEKYPYYGSRLSEDLFERGLCIPSGSNLTKDDLERVSSIILKLFK
ncbi:MAG TPA: DegT/DnrJ/EryC1/StrS family aminotransferase, partial [Cytophagaceae bacterium]